MDSNIKMPKTPLVKVTLLVTILYILTFVANAYLISRLNFPPTLSNFTTTLSLLLCSVLLLISIDIPLIVADFKFPSIGWSGIFLLTIASLIFLEISGSILGKIGDLDIPSMCGYKPIDHLKAIKTGLLSPAVETILFVKILPTLYFRKYPNSSPFWVFLVVGIFFSLMHFRFSPVGFGGALLSGIIFCYVYYGTGSLLASFLMHASINATLLLLDKFCAHTTEAFLYINDLALYLLAATAIAVISASIYVLDRRIQLRKPV